MANQEIIDYNLTIETSESIDRVTSILSAQNIPHQIVMVEERHGVISAKGSCSTIIALLTPVENTIVYCN